MKYRAVMVVFLLGSPKEHSVGWRNSIPQSSLKILLLRPSKTKIFYITTHTHQSPKEIVLILILILMVGLYINLLPNS